MSYSSRSIEDGGRRLSLPGMGGGEGGSSRRWLYIGGGVVVVVLLAWLIFGGHKDAGAGRKPVAQLANVTVVVPGRQAVSRTINATGSLAAKREMPVGVAGEGGRVTAVLVEPGQWVGAGQVLATVDRSVQTQTAASLAAQISVAQANADLAQANYQRAQALVGNGFISKADLDQKRASRDAAMAQVKVARAALGETQARNGRLDIRAPAAGLVLTRQVEPGQVISSGSGVLFRMAKGGELEMRAQMSEGDLAGLHAGVPATVTPVGSAQSFQGSVWQVSPVIDPQTRQGIARIQLSYNPALRPGGFAQAVVMGGAASSPVLPQSAVLSDAKGNYVYIVDRDDKVVRRDVVLGQVNDAGVAIASGIDGSERVVLAAGAFLNPGQKVRPTLTKLSS